MFKYLAIAFILQMCNCQYILNGGGLNGLGGQIVSLGQSYGGLYQGGAPQYIILQAVPQQLQTVALAPVARPLTIRAQPPIIAPQVIAAPQPARVIIQQAPRPVFTSVSEEISGPAEPYTFGYQTSDEEGNQASRQETSDGSGNVRGSYSYTDIQGLNRIVDYIADDGGYRANIRTNEPGTANANPADVKIQAEEPPAAVVARYANPPYGKRI